MGAFDATLGAFLVGVLGSGCLWGVTCAQVWHYFHTYVEDPLWTKALVSVVWISDTAHQVLITYGLYFYMVTHFGDVDMLRHSTPTIAVQTGVQGFTAFLVQCFFTYRIWKLSGKNKYMAGGVLILVVAQFALVIVNTIRNYMAPVYETQDNRVTTAVAVAVAVFTDLVIAAVLCVLLRRGKAGLESDEMVAHTNSVVRRLMVFSMNTGLLTSLWVLAFFITYLALPDSYVYMAMFFVSGRLYVNSLMVALNMRETMRRLWNQRRSFPVHLDGRASLPVMSPIDAIALKSAPFRTRPPASASSDVSNTHFSRSDLEEARSMSDEIVAI